MLTRRQKDLLRKMSKETTFKPNSYYADKLSVSPKTVWNDLKEIEKQIESSDLEIVRKQGQGIRLVQHNLNFLPSLLSQGKVNSSMDVTRRRREIIDYLLSNSDSYTSIQALSEKYYVSKTSIVNDFNSIELWLDRYDLSLYRGLEGTKVVGSEDNIRKALAAYLLDFPSNQKINKTNMGSRLDQETFENILAMFNKKDILFFEKSLSEIEVMLDINIPSPYYLNLLTHLLLTLKRADYSNDLELFEKDCSVDEPLYLEAVEYITKQVQETYRIEYSKREKQYILQYLLGSVADTDCHVLSDEYHRLNHSLIDEFQVYTGEDLSGDHLLYNGLLMHMKPMINRLNFQISVINPMKEDLYKKYFNYLFVLSFILNIKLKSYFNAALSDDEIAYVATYFIAAIERKNKDIKVLVVCQSGYGTSQLLRTRLEQQFGNIHIVEEISLRELQDSNLDNIDLVISTVYIEELSVPHIVISVVLNEVEVQKIENMIGKINDENKRIRYCLNKNIEVKNLSSEAFNRKLKNSSCIFTFDDWVIYFKESNEEEQRLLRKEASKHYLLTSSEHVQAMFEILTNSRLEM